ncbi:unnamed protein product [Cuscuta epithymum]|uniref:Agenet domain-containing protein n=1 Tax=Cuscuta epithymum TaxID=186058 RepID=A0AAV0FAJ8_9ASTE|nr:unnamed protein product [Cuscuta epithymum]
MGGLAKKRKEKEQLFAKGSLIEVRTNEEGFSGAWFEAVVVNPDPSDSATKSAYKKKKKAAEIYVQYDTLLADDGHSLLKEFVPQEYIRPRPPPQTVEGFKLNDTVEACYKDGWWTGVVTKVLPSSRYTVTFDNPPDELEFGLPELRFHRRWLNGKWTQPKKKKAGLTYSVGGMVEVSFDGVECKDAWFPSKIVKSRGDGCFLVKTPRPNGESEKELTRLAFDDGIHIRPCPPLHIKQNHKSYGLLDKVDAFYDFGWWLGVVSKILLDDEYVVVFQHAKKERVLNHSDLRPHMIWKDRKWYTSQGELVSSYCNIEEGDNCNDLDMIQSDIPSNNQCTPTNGTTGEGMTSSLVSDGEKSQQLTVWNASSSRVSVTVKKQRLDLSTGGSTQLPSYDTSKKKESECETPAKEIPCSFSSPDQSSMGNTAERNGSEVNEQGSVSGPHRKKGRPSKYKAKRPQPIAQEGTPNRKRGRPPKALVETPDVHIEYQVPAAIETRGEENVGSVGMEKIGHEDSSNVSDDQPLSTWVGKVHTVTDVDGSTSNGERGTESGEKSAEQNPNGKVTTASELHQSLPFVKKDTRLWNIIESREAFHKIPQNPHFRPLEHVEDFRREAQAFFYMGTFTDIVDKACKLEVDGPRSTIDGMLATLVELESHGFNVAPIRGRLNEVLSYKDKLESLQALSKESCDEMEKLNMDKEELMKQKAELEKGLSQVVSRIESKDNDIAFAQSRMDETREKTRHLRQDLDALTRKPF